LAIQDKNSAGILEGVIKTSREVCTSQIFSGFGSNHPVMMKMGILSGIFPIG
jgi:hypothetical protein